MALLIDCDDSDVTEKRTVATLVNALNIPYCYGSTMA